MRPPDEIFDAITNFQIATWGRIDTADAVYGMERLTWLIFGEDIHTPSDLDKFDKKRR